MRRRNEDISRRENINRLPLRGCVVQVTANQTSGPLRGLVRFNTGSDSQ